MLGTGVVLPWVLQYSSSDWTACTEASLKAKKMLLLFWWETPNEARSAPHSKGHIRAAMCRCVCDNLGTSWLSYHSLNPLPSLAYPSFSAPPASRCDVSRRKATTAAAAAATRTACSASEPGSRTTALPTPLPLLLFVKR